VDLDSGGRLIIHGAYDDGAVTNADVELVDAQGNRWSATVLTLPEVGRIMETWQASGGCQSGAYLRVPDLVIVRDPNPEAVVQVFAELHRTGEHRTEMMPIAE
jgi:hypothetical protein